MKIKSGTILKKIFVQGVFPVLLIIFLGLILKSPVLACPIGTPPGCSQRSGGHDCFDADTVCWGGYNPQGEYFGAAVVDMAECLGAGVPCEAWETCHYITFFSQECGDCCWGGGGGGGGNCGDPGQPEPLTFSSITGVSARVSWPGVSWGDESGDGCSPNNHIGCVDDDGDGIRGYVGRICTGNYCYDGGTEIDILTCTSNTFWDISGLTFGTRYYVYIWSINSCTCDKRKRSYFDTVCPPASRVLTGSCTAGGTANLSWDEAPGAAYYSLRVDNLADVGDWDGSCSSPAGDFCANVPSSICRRGICRYSFAGNPGDTYDWWVHPRGANDCWGAGPHGPNFTCLIPSCTSATLSPSSPPNVPIVEGEPQVFVVSSIDFTGGADWSNIDHVEFISSNPGVLTVSPAVDNDGSNGYSTTATAITIGTATITADVYFTP